MNPLYYYALLDPKYNLVNSLTRFAQKNNFFIHFWQMNNDFHTFKPEFVEFIEQNFIEIRS